MNRILEQIFADFIENHALEDSAEVKMTTESAISYLKENEVIDTEDIEYLMTNLGYEYEKQGFVNGFLYGLQIRNVTQKVGVAS